MIAIPIISILMIVFNIRLYKRIDRGIRAFIEENESTDMFFLLQKRGLHGFCTFIAILDWGLIIFLYFATQLSAIPDEYPLAAMIFGFMALLMNCASIDEGSWCVIGYSDRILYHLYPKGVRTIKPEDVVRFVQKNQKKYIIELKNEKVRIKSKETHAIVKMKNGEMIKDLLYSSRLMFDNNPITNLMDSWGKRG